MYGCHWCRKERLSTKSEHGAVVLSGVLLVEVASGWLFLFSRDIFARASIHFVQSCCCRRRYYCLLQMLGSTQPKQVVVMGMSRLCKWISYSCLGGRKHAMPQGDFGLADLFAWPCLLGARDGNARMLCPGRIQAVHDSMKYKGVDADSGLAVQGVKGREGTPSWNFIRGWRCRMKSSTLSVGPRMGKGSNAVENESRIP